MVKHKIIVGITGASGAIYARNLLEQLGKFSDQLEEVSVIFSENAKKVWSYELDSDSSQSLPFPVYENTDFFAPMASGSARFDAMIICPCSMGTLGKIAHGIADNLIVRSADVMLKERRKLILVPRECPYNLIHLENMKSITLAGGIIAPANPSFYSKPGSIEELVGTVTHRVLELAGFSLETYRWKS
ncbi:MAG: UbiX family flavin prenyltransferase [Bacteroidota bacterium]|nr:UbiX family flavin prenyltransferase [Bacteroidota bacterium]